jgi:hypothetical protein
VAREGGEGGGCGRLSSCRRRLRVLLLPATCEDGNGVLFREGRGVLFLCLPCLKFQVSCLLGRGRGLGGLAIFLCVDLGWNRVKVGMEGWERYSLAEFCSVLLFVAMLRS